jgi:hypothetical protein
MAFLRSKGSPDNAKHGEKFAGTERSPRAHVVNSNEFASDYPRAVMDEPKRPEPEIVPPVTETEPRREGVEVPPDKDAPEKRSPASAEER